MIIQLENGHNGDQQDNITKSMSECGMKVSHVRTQFKDYLIGLGGGEFDIRSLGGLDGVEDIHYVDDAYQLVSRMWKTSTSSVDLGDGVAISGDEWSLMAGPCSIESEEQIVSVADKLVSLGIKIMRGGVYKPRTSPYAYRGGGIDFLKLWYKHCQERGLKIITEVMDARQIDEMLPYVDIFQVGTRNAQNFNLLDALGKTDKGVMLKRGMSGTVDELLQAAEYVFSAGNERIILCERGIRTYEKAYRNTMDLNAVAVLKDKSHLPVIADPSHGIGLRKYVPQLALASLMAGADGVIVEAHPEPEKSISDAAQTISFQSLELLVGKIKALREVVV
ncbi:MAG: 3-deoxy-7-phosphoheptulonate synthase [Flavobacteriales bacterium]|nr:3-deoxy-7-phosphoheptulonate synthase [Flavobacteriales bacterium]